LENALLAEVAGLKKEIDARRPFPPAVAAKLKEYYVVEWTHHSTAIEGNTLDLAETRVVLEGITVGGKTLREHLEIIDHRDAIEYVESYVHEEIPLTEGLIRNIHRLVMKNTLPEEAGRYRRGGVVIAGSRHRPPEGIAVPALMKELVTAYNGGWQAEHPVKRAALLHWRMVFIHPFLDGNGRTARLLMNFSLMRDGYPPVIFKKEDRVRYLDNLEKASVEGDLGPFFILTLERLAGMLRLYADLLAGC